MEDRLWNLGLVRVVGSLPAEKRIELVQKDIVCSATDGASVMQKVGRLSNCACAWHAKYFVQKTVNFC
jgi:hypothetical protein